MVYAHLGMSEPKARSEVIINYSKSKVQVYEDIARYIYVVTRGFAILAFVENDNLDTRAGLPTWVPDWPVKSESESFHPRHPLSYLDHYAKPQNSFEVRWKTPSDVLIVQESLAGAVLHIPLQRQLPPLPMEGDPEDQEFDAAILDWVLHPANRELIKLLLATTMEPGFDHDKYQPA